MSFYSSAIVCYKNKEFDRIIKIMKKEKLFDESVLLENINKVIPVNEVLSYYRKEKITGINYNIYTDRILFYIYL